MKHLSASGSSAPAGFNIAFQDVLGFRLTVAGSGKKTVKPDWNMSNHHVSKPRALLELN